MAEPTAAQVDSAMTTADTSSAAATTEPAPAAPSSPPPPTGSVSPTPDDQPATIDATAAADTTPEDDLSAMLESALSSLVRPEQAAINALTMIAADHKEDAQTIVDTIVRFATKTPPKSRLPTLYVIDSIVKKLRAFQSMFEAHIAKIFTTTYVGYPVNQRATLVRLLNVWEQQKRWSPSVIETMRKQAALVGLPPEPQAAPKAAATDSKKHAHDPRIRQPPAKRPQSVDVRDQPRNNQDTAAASTMQQTQAMLLAMQQAMFAAQQQRHQQMMYMQQMQAMQQQQQQPQLPAQNFSMLPGASKPSSAMPQYQQQRPPQFMPPPQQQQPFGQPPYYPPPGQYQHPSQQQHQPAFGAPQQINPNLTPQQRSELDQLDSILNTLRGQLADRPDVYPLINQIRSALAAGQGDFEQSVNALTQALSTAPPTAATPAAIASDDPEAVQQNAPPMPPTPPKALTSDLKTKDVYVIWKLYNGWKLQCKNCGLRTPTQKQMTEHLDYHFKLNRLQNNRAGVTRSQGWLATEDEWLNSDDVLFSDDQKGPADDSSNPQLTAGPVVQVVQRVAVDETQKVCPICRDQFHQVWDADNEEWMYNNALRVSKVEELEDLKATDKDNKRKAIHQQYAGQIVHATCYESLLVVANPLTLAAKLLSTDALSETVGDLKHEATVKQENGATSDQPPPLEKPAAGE